LCKTRISILYFICVKRESPYYYILLLNLVLFYTGAGIAAGQQSTGNLWVLLLLYCWAIRHIIILVRVTAQGTTYILLLLLCKAKRTAHYNYHYWDRCVAVNYIYILYYYYYINCVLKQQLNIQDLLVIPFILELPIFIRS